MGVGVGSFLDTTPGSVHLLEHLMIANQQKFEDFLSLHGGKNYLKGVTSLDHTLFSFQIHPEFLEDALNRFAKMFTTFEPEPESLNREIVAVDAEFHLKLNDDIRMTQFKNSVSRLDTLKSLFPWGNKETLKELKLESMIDFFDNYYFGCSMKLAVTTSQSLGELEEWVKRFFSNIKSKWENIPQLEVQGQNPWNPHIFYQLQSIEQRRTLEVSWWIPPNSDRGGLLYMSSLLGQECKGSLISLWRERGWAINIEVDIQGADIDSFTKFGSSLMMLITLTKSGITKIGKIVSSIYEYIRQVVGQPPQMFIFEEYTTLQTNKMKCFDYVDAELLANMLSVKDIKQIMHDPYYPQWDSDVVQNLTGHLRPDNMRIIFHNKSSSITATNAKVEPYFFSLYKEEKFPEESLQVWNASNGKLNRKLFFPKPNPYMCDYEISSSDGSSSSLDGSDESRSRDDDGGSDEPRDDDDGDDGSSSDDDDDDASDIPSTFVDTPSMKVYFRGGGGEEGMAHANFLIHFGVDEEKVGDEEKEKKKTVKAKGYLMARLFIDLLKDHLSDILHMGSRAGYETSITLLSTKRIALKVSGWRGKFCKFIGDMVERLKNFLPSNANRFEIFKDSMRIILSNEELNIADLAENEMDRFLNSSLTNEEIMVVMKSISFEDVTKFIPNPILKSQVYIEGICSGNLDEEVARQIVEVFEKGGEPPTSHRRTLLEYVKVQEVPLENKLSLDLIARNKFDENALAKLYFEISRGEEGEDKDKGYEDWGKLHLLPLIMAKELVYQLRTCEGLGYGIHCRPHFMDGGASGFSIQVISPNHEPHYLSERIICFLQDFQEKLESMSVDIYNHWRGVAISSALGKCEWWDEIVKERYSREFFTKAKVYLSFLEKKLFLNGSR